MSKVIADELYWNEEVQELSAWNRQVAAKCTALAHATQAEHVKWLVDNKDFAFESVQRFVDRGGQAKKPGGHPEIYSPGRCRLMSLTSRSWRSIFWTLKERAAADRKSA